MAKKKADDGKKDTVPMTFIGAPLTPTLSPLEVGVGKGSDRIVSVPSLIDYSVSGKQWRCGKFDSLVMELGEPTMTAETIIVLHSSVCGLERSWRILRRLFGIMPVVVPSDYPMEDMRSWMRDELCQDMGLTRAQLQQELDGIRGLWRGVAPRPEVGESKSEVGDFSGELPLEADKELMEKYGLVVAFEMGEKNFFMQRVRDFEKVLGEKTTAGLARNILMTELQVLRIDRLLADSSKNRVGGTEWRANMNQRKSLDDTYRDQLEQLRRLAPWFSTVGGKYAFAGVISDITAAMQNYYALGDATLVDGIFTATEIQVELRRSVQAPEPRYRAGLVVFLNMAKSFLFDRDWKNTFPPAQFKKLDVAWKSTVMAEEQKAGEPLVDLENEGEYPNLAMKKGE